MTLASIFFTGANVGADTVAKQILDSQLNQVSVDINVYFGKGHAPINTTMLEQINTDIQEITHVETLSKLCPTCCHERALLPDSNETYSKQAYFVVCGIMGNSRVYDGLTITKGSPSLGANEAYIWTGSESSGDLEFGDVLHFGVEAKILQFTVVGFVDLDDQALGIIGDRWHWDETLDRTVEVGILLVDWNETLSKTIGAEYIRSNVLIFLDRDAVVNPWDIDSSIERLRLIMRRVRNIIFLSTGEWEYVDSHLESVLNNYIYLSQTMRLQFIITSIPVFLIAWYMGTTLSDVSYNLRRREIGLLLTKGFSRRQLFRMFIGESIIVGLVGSLVGVGLSYTLTPFFIQGGVFPAVRPVLLTETVVLSVIFTVVLTLLSVFRPARRASNLEVIDALQEYRYVEEVKPYKSRWAWIAFILGSYKIIIWLLGINLVTMMMGPPPSNIFITILLGGWTFFDTFVLNYFGPILFFWGLTKLFIRGSLKFQEFVAKLVKFSGDLNVLSTKNIRRNPARTAAIAFLIAMIVGYSFQVIGTYASEKDYTIRNVRFTVGSDINVHLTTLQNLQSTIDKIGNISNVSSQTVEYKFYHYTGEEYMMLIAVEPEAWLDIAYYEDSLFTGNEVASAFQEMENDNYTIILERGIAESLNLKISDPIAVKFNSEVFHLKVVGFFGPSQLPQWHGSYGSYVPVGFYEEVKNEVGANTKILVKLKDDGDGKTVAEEIRDLKLSGVSTVYSVAEVLEWGGENPLGTNVPTAFLGVIGSSEIQRLGVTFALIAASLGAALIILVSLRERSKEVGIMSVRGLSFKQVVSVLLTENLAVVGFAVFLGAIVGLIVIQGNVSAANSISTYIPSPEPFTISMFSPIQRRMIFPLNTILTLGICCLLVFSSTIIPVILTVKRYISQIERIVREA